jgi:hypothetical protein
MFLTYLSCSNTPSQGSPMCHVTFFTKNFTILRDLLKKISYFRTKTIVSSLKNDNVTSHRGGGQRQCHRMTRGGRGDRGV